jgi:hypothetical protein
MYQVEWLENALDQLAAIWMLADAALRQAITAATNQIDQLLANDPHNVGESRPGGRRVLLVAPLGVTYRIDGQQVTVLRVWLFQRRRP